MEQAYIILLCLNSALLPVVTATLVYAFMLEKKLTKTLADFKEIGKVASESSKNQAKFIQDLSDKVAAMQMNGIKSR